MKFDNIDEQILMGMKDRGEKTMVEWLKLLKWSNKESSEIAEKIINLTRLELIDVRIKDDFVDTDRSYYSNKVFGLSELGTKYCKRIREEFERERKSLIFKLEESEDG